MLARSKARTTGVVPGHRRQPGAGSVSRLRGFDAPPQLTTTGPSRTGTTRSGGRAPASTRAARPTGADGCPRVPPCTSDRRNWRGNPESPVASAYALESIVLEGFEGGHRRTEGAHKLHVTIQNLLGTVVGRPSRSGETEPGGWHPRWFGGRLGGATGSVRGGDQQGQRSRTGAVSGSMATPLHLVGPSDWCPLVGGRKSGGQVAPDAVGGRIPWFGGRGRTTAGRADRDRPGRRPSRNPTLEARATPAGLEHPPWTRDRVWPGEVIPYSGMRCSVDPGSGPRPPAFVVATDRPEAPPIPAGGPARASRTVARASELPAPLAEGSSWSIAAALAERPRTTVVQRRSRWPGVARPVVSSGPRGRRPRWPRGNVDVRRPMGGAGQPARPAGAPGPSRSLIRPGVTSRPATRGRPGDTSAAGDQLRTGSIHPAGPRSGRAQCRGSRLERS